MSPSTRMLLICIQEVNKYHIIKTVQVIFCSASRIYRIRICNNADSAIVQVICCTPMTWRLMAWCFTNKVFATCYTISLTTCSTPSTLFDQSTGLTCSLIDLGQNSPSNFRIRIRFKIRLTDQICQNLFHQRFVPVRRTNSD